MILNSKSITILTNGSTTEKKYNYGGDKVAAMAIQVRHASQQARSMVMPQPFDFQQRQGDGREVQETRQPQLQRPPAVVAAYRYLA